LLAPLFLEQRVAERTRELSSLLEISHTVSSTLQLKPLLGLILDQLKLVSDYTGSSILTVEGDGLVFLDHHGSVPQEQLVRLHFPLEQLGPIWETIATRSSILIHDVHEETPQEIGEKVWLQPGIARRFGLAKLPIHLHQQRLLC